jgi:hypothetical protein
MLNGNKGSLGLYLAYVAVMNTSSLIWTDWLPFTARNQARTSMIAANARASISGLYPGSDCLIGKIDEMPT